MQPKILQKYDPDTMKVKLCKECKGLGVVTNPEYGTKEICSACHGQGRIVVKTNETEFSITQIDFAADGQLLIKAPQEEETLEEEEEACPSCTN